MQSKWNTCVRQVLCPLSKPVCINGKKYLDGGIADSIPIDKIIALATTELL